jgi:aryl carrier-like protein
MIPFAIVALDRFPLNANGKIDRTRLPPPSSLKVSLSTDDEPQNELELYLHRLWCRLLGTGRVPRDANLYALGANSLQFMLAANDYHSQLRSKNAQLDLSDFIRHATIAQHADILLTKQNQTIPTPVWQSQRLTEGYLCFLAYLTS